MFLEDVPWNSEIPPLPQGVLFVLLPHAFQVSLDSLATVLNSGRTSAEIVY